MGVLRHSALAALMAAGLGVPAEAAVVYSLTGEAGFSVLQRDDQGNPIEDPQDPGQFLFETLIQSISFLYTASDFVTDDALVTPDNCAIGDGSVFVCGMIGLDAGPNQFGGTDDFVDFKFENADGSGGGGGFLFFAAGALGASGTYTNAGFPVGTPSFGNFASATLTVTSTVAAVPLPAGLPLLLGGLAALALVRRRRRSA